MKWINRSLIALLLLGTTTVCFASSNDFNDHENIDYSKRPQTHDFIDKLAKQGFPKPESLRLLSDAKRQNSILTAISRPAEGRLTWGQYRSHFLTQQRIQAGLDFWHANAAIFKKAEATYGVPAPIVLGILGVETFYGRNMGHYRVLDALATLGFDYPPRSQFFMTQLGQFFLLSKEAHLDPLTTEGSYAGAMGMAQFIPSSYRSYAVDFDKNGRTDLYQPADAIGSIANYFAMHGWQKGLPVAAYAKVDGETYPDIFANASLKPSLTTAMAAKNGIQATNCRGNHVPTPYCFSKLPKATLLAPLELDGTYGTEYWLTTSNFYTITRYNHSPLYAMAVFQLATRIQAANRESH